MLQLNKLWTLLPLAFLLSCSSAENSETVEDPLADEAMGLEDAGTDAVPEANIEDLDDLVPEDDFKEESATANAEEMPPVENLPMVEEESTKEAEATPPPTTNDIPMEMGVATYNVRSGDTLMKIAFEIYGDVFQWRKIYEMNRDQISDPNVLPQGLSLKTESSNQNIAISRNGERFQIRQGDTLGTISQDVYGTPSKWKRIWKNNPELIKDPNKIFAGFYLYYTFTPEDQAEKERLQNNQFQPRVPASAPQTDPAFVPAMPSVPPVQPSVDVQQ